MIFLLIPIVLSKSYYYDSISLEINFYENGAAIVKQTRDYNFDGNFSWAYIDFNKVGLKDITIISFIDLDTVLMVKLI